MRRSSCDAQYYQQLHDGNPAFRHNNWLLQDIQIICAQQGNSLLELGCGNGLFLELAARSFPHVVGVDWARSPVIDEILDRTSGIEFIQADILEWTPMQQFDIVVSADFLEHLPPDGLLPALRGFHSFGRTHYHRIACYDDGHSHLSIYPPERWMALFHQVAPGQYRLFSSEVRKGNPLNQVITIGSFQSVQSGHPVPFHV